MPLRKRVADLQEREDLRKAFANMAAFDIRPTSSNRETYGIYLRSSGTHIGTIKKGLGNLLFRTLALLSDHARRRSLPHLPYPSNVQRRLQRALEASAPVIPATPPLILLPARSVADASPVDPGEQPACNDVV